MQYIQGPEDNQPYESGQRPALPKRAAQGVPSAPTTRGVTRIDEVSRAAAAIAMWADNPGVEENPSTAPTRPPVELGYTETDYP
ncbi:hypothetical protein [Nocardia aurea]|uniref:Uncharacterized protein n=1 Tax=Nocardia aurea TaxID=2144174 RepID=A0ABV3FNH5_9NOCA